jgi:hypothetical protein
MAEYLCIGDWENVVYVDDSNVWQTGSNVEEVVRKLTEKAALFHGLHKEHGPLNECVKDTAPPLGQRGQRGRRHHYGGREHHHPQHNYRAPGCQLQ